MHSVKISRTAITPSQPADVIRYELGASCHVKEGPDEDTAPVWCVVTAMSPAPPSSAAMSRNAIGTRAGSDPWTSESFPESSRPMC